MSFVRNFHEIVQWVEQTKLPDESPEPTLDTRTEKPVLTRPYTLTPTSKAERLLALFQEGNALVKEIKSAIVDGYSLKQLQHYVLDPFFATAPTTTKPAHCL